MIAQAEITVVIAEDDDLNLLLTTHLVRRHKNCQIVGVARNGADALLQVAALNPDLLIMDYHMPKVDGLQTVQKLRRLGCTAKIILLSADDFDEDWLPEGIDRFVHKGCLVSKLKLAIDGLFASTWGLSAPQENFSHV